MSQIVLKRSITGEYTPRYYIMTGGDFDAMLDAVKALSFRRFLDTEKAWQIKGDGIEALRKAGYTVTKEPDVKVELADVDRPVRISGNSAEVDIILNYRLDTGEWKARCFSFSKYEKTLTMSFTDEQIAQQVDAFMTDEIVIKLYPDMEVRRERSHGGAMHRLVNAEIANLSQKAQETFVAHAGKRGKDEHRQAVQAVWSVINV